MTKNKKYLFLLIIPSFLFITAGLLKESHGPYYLNFYDPSYAYLINSLNLAQLNGSAPGQVEHPGTPVQSAGALIIKIYHFIFEKDKDIVISVLSNPEKYLFIMNKSFVLLNCISLFGLGVLTFAMSKDLTLSLLIQLSAFVSIRIFYVSILVSPENFLIFSSLALTGLLIYYLYKIDTGRKIPLSYIVLMGVVFGFGIATKINFFPLLIIPFVILKGIRTKMIFSVIVIISFIVCVFPALENSAAFIEWINKLFFKSGKYGAGDSTIINSTAFMSNLKLILTKDLIFTISYFISLLTVIISFISKPKEIPVIVKKEITLIRAIFLSMSLQIILVAKHFALYYLIPSIMISTLALIISISILSFFAGRYFEGLNLNYIFILLIIFIISWSALNVIPVLFNWNKQKSEAISIQNYINKNYKDQLIITGFGSADPECALAFGVMFAGDQKAKYESILMSFQKQHIFFNPWESTFYSLNSNNDNLILPADRKKIILHMNNYGTIEGFKNAVEKSGFKVISAEKIFTNDNLDTVYEISLN